MADIKSAFQQKKKKNNNGLRYNIELCFCKYKQRRAIGALNHMQVHTRHQHQHANCYMVELQKNKKEVDSVNNLYSNMGPSPQK